VNVKYWAGGPNNELPPGHWNLFAQFVSHRDGHGRDLSGTEKDVKMFFALTNGNLDACIAAWGNKRVFDYVRPITAIRSLFRGQKVSAWGGPGKGTQMIDGETWFPYHPATFPTPPFSEYVSGHSTFGAAGAEIMKRFTGSDDFGASATFKAGTSGFEPNVPATDLTLTWKTFTDAADAWGISRRYGGLHFEKGDLDGKDLGRKVGSLAWDKAQSYFNGTAPAGAPQGRLPRTD
jgi:hypothetical protein